MQLLTLSKCKITLGNSRDYQRLAIVLYGLTLILLSSSALSLPLKLISLVFLLYQLHRVLAAPHLIFSEISFNSGKWLLHNRDGQSEEFEKHRIVLEAGIFFLIEFIKGNQRKSFVLFFDQLQTNDYRLLRLIEKIH